MLHIALSFHLIMYTNIKINKGYHHTFLSFAAKQQQT